MQEYYSTKENCKKERQDDYFCCHYSLLRQLSLPSVTNFLFLYRIRQTIIIAVTIRESQRFAIQVNTWDQTTFFAPM